MDGGKIQLRDGSGSGNLSATNLKELIEQRALVHPNRAALNFLHYGELDQQESLSYADLDTYARAILSALRTACKKGDRVLLLFPAGNHFVAAFVACLYGGLVSVPAAIPGRRQDWERVRSIIEDCQPTAILSVGLHFRRIDKHLKENVPAWNGTMLDVEEIRSSQGIGVVSSEIAGDDLAFLQYTSGSTGSPKGVMVSHDNLFHNERVIQAAFDTQEASRFVSWLPMFHDMGLIGYALHALFLGAELNFMAPEAFLQRPLRWLEAISHFRGSFSGGPNFAFDLCVARYEAEACKDLNLSSWQCAPNGAEPVRPSTLERFSQTFAKHGLAETTLCPVYGLAEGVLVVSGRPNRRPKLLRAKSEEYARGVVAPIASEEIGATLVGVGPILGDQHALIVDPQTLAPVEGERMGEIWLSGPSVTKGYWQKEELTQESFQARPSGADSARTYLRTGDLGYFDSDGELYITGRLKDTIIISGKNYFPQDLECVIETVDKVFRPGGGAVFGIEHDGQERLIVLQELNVATANDLDTTALLKAIRAKIATEFQLSVFDVCLLKPRTLLRTTSGKIQRQRNKQAYLSSKLEPLAQHRAEARRQRDEAITPSGHAIFEIVRAWMQKTLDVPHIAPDDLFVDTGLDSARAVNLAADLSEQLGQRVDVQLLWSHPEVFRFCEAVAQQIRPRATLESGRERPAEAKTKNVHELSDDELRALIEKELA